MAIENSNTTEQCETVNDGESFTSISDYENKLVINSNATASDLSEYTTSRIYGVYCALDTISNAEQRYHQVHTDFLFALMRLLEEARVMHEECLRLARNCDGETNR